MGNTAALKIAFLRTKTENKIVSLTARMNRLARPQTGRGPQYEAYIRDYPERSGLECALGSLRRERAVLLDMSYAA